MDSDSVHDRLPIEPVDDEIVREVFATFGLAIYRAQVMEQQMTRLLMACDAAPAEWSRATLDAADADVQRLAASEYCDRIRGAIPGAPLIAALESAITLRNHLRGSFFRDNRAAVATRSGCTAMINELDHAMDVFHVAALELDQLTEPVVGAHGVTVDHADARIVEVRAGDF